MLRHTILRSSRLFSPLSATPAASITPIACSFATKKPSAHSVLKTPELDPSSTAYTIMRELGLQKHLNKVYKTTTLSFGGALGISYLCAASKFALLHPGFCMAAGGIGSLLSVIAFNFTRYENKMVHDQQGNKFLTSVNSPARKFLYGSFVGCTGLMMSPVLAHYCMLNPLIIPTALGITAGICSGASLYAYVKPKGSLLWLGGPLMGCLLSLVGVQLISALSFWAYGPNMFSLMAYRADLYLGTALFTGFVAYDTHVAVKNYEDGNADHLGASLSMFLNFQNIFLRMLEIVSSFWGDS